MSTNRSLGRQLLLQALQRHTQAEIARWCRVSPSTISRLASGRPSDSFKLRKRLERYGISIDSWEHPPHVDRASVHDHPAYHEDMTIKTIKPGNPETEDLRRDDAARLLRQIALDPNRSKEERDRASQAHIALTGVKPEKPEGHPDPIEKEDDEKAAHASPAARTQTFAPQRDPSQQASRNIHESLDRMRRAPRGW